jgi:hypothetical protein
VLAAVHESQPTRNIPGLGGSVSVKVVYDVLVVVVGVDTGRSIIVRLLERHSRVGFNGSEPASVRR